MFFSIIDIIWVVFFLVASIPFMPIIYLLRISPMYKLGYKLAHIGAKILLVPVRILSGIRLTVIGQENLTKDEGVLYVGNHCSYFDIVLSYCTFKTCTGYIAKRDLGQIPLLNVWMVLVGCFFLKRDNPRDGMRMIKKAAENIQKGNSMVIFPEGTRNKNEDEQLVQEFHAGSFHIAQKSGCKIVPMAITGTADVFEKHLPKVKPGRVIIQYGEAIDTSKLDRAELKQLPDTVRNIILEMRKEHMAIIKSK